MDEQDTRRRVRELIADSCPRGASAVDSADTLVADLGYDSLALIELFFQLETEFQVGELDSEKAVDMVTVADIEEFVLTIMRAQAG